MMNISLGKVQCRRHKWLEQRKDVAQETAAMNKGDPRVDIKLEWQGRQTFNNISREGNKSAYRPYRLLSNASIELKDKLDSFSVGASNINTYIQY